MNDSTQPTSTAIAGFSIPPGARAVLVRETSGGKFEVRPIKHDDSVLNIETDLLDHLNGYPHSDEWLEELRDYCESRLAARAEARRTDGVTIARQRGRWEIAHVQAFQAFS